MTPNKQLRGNSPSREWNGIVAFLTGPIGILFGHFSWLANHLLFFAWYALSKGRGVLARISAVSAILLAFSFLFGRTIILGTGGEVPYRVLDGYFIWLASLVVAAAEAFLVKHERKEGKLA